MKIPMSISQYAFFLHDRRLIPWAYQASCWVRCQFLPRRFLPLIGDGRTHNNKTQK